MFCGNVVDSLLSILLKFLQVIWSAICYLFSLLLDFGLETLGYCLKVFQLNIYPSNLLVDSWAASFVGNFMGSHIFSLVSLCVTVFCFVLVLKWIVKLLRG